jgi:hypothetical protein
MYHNSNYSTYFLISAVFNHASSKAIPMVLVEGSLMYNLRPKNKQYKLLRDSMVTNSAERSSKLSSTKRNRTELTRPRNSTISSSKIFLKIQTTSS